MVKQKHFVVLTFFPVHTVYLAKISNSLTEDNQSGGMTDVLYNSLKLANNPPGTSLTTDLPLHLLSVFMPLKLTNKLKKIRNSSRETELRKSTCGQKISKIM